MSLKNFMSYEDAATVLGEYADKVNELKSGLTNYEAKIDAALDVPENTGKNVLPLTLAQLKSVNTTGTWADNVYTLNGVDFTVNIDNDGRVSGITANGTASANTNFFFVRNSPNIYSGYILNGSVGGSGESYYIALSLNSSPWTTNTCYNSDTRITIPKTATIESYIRVANGYAANNVTFYPMIRPATITDPTFAPYIPSVESRLTGLNSALLDIFAPTNKLTASDDLNSVIKPGSYYTRGSDNPAHNPGANSFIYVIKQCRVDDVARYVQIVYSFNNDKLYIRRTIDSGDNWTDWASIDTTVVN